ncbi:MAG TPA: tRNA (guanosine(37)-N1)-methyltransferase TrmD [Planctomycetota bacterium]|nr:tRNA (guanosine(37)-N1)-methyltransferase TrmD [Planctomycetota bacterium]
MRVDIVTIFPRMFEGVLGESILKIAQEKSILRAKITYLRDFTTDRHKSVDDRPYGGGPGMVMKVEPVVKAVRAIRQEEPEEPGRLLMMCPGGRKFDQAYAHELATSPRLIFIAGHYEGYDERIVECLHPEKVSIGDYVLTGGELPALVVIDAVVRLLPGVLGDDESIKSESFSPDNQGLLEYPQYTRPAEFEGLKVPEVLVSGNHARVAEWRREQARLKTEQHRPDLLQQSPRPPERKDHYED